MENYTKLFNSIITSTIWTEDDKTRIVWITMLAIADQHGEVQASIPGLARVAGVSVEAAETAINRFLSPDAYSRTPDDEGRRIEKIDGGWALLNHGKYRLMASKEQSKTANAARQQRFRLNKARNLSGDESDKCAYCGEKANGIDHIIPKSKGGKEDKTNLVRSCGRCNNHKNAQYLLNFLNDHTLPYNLSSESIMGNENLSRLVTLSNGKWVSVTVITDIVEAEADTEVKAEEELNKLHSHTISAKDSVCVIESPFMDSPKETKSTMDDLMSKINALKSSWGKLARWTRNEMEALRGGVASQMETLTDDDWQLLKDFLNSTQVGYFRPDQRSKLCESFSGIWSTCERWKTETKYRTNNGTKSLFY